MSQIPKVEVKAPNPDEELWIVCPECHRQTSHRILSHVQSTWTEEEEGGYCGFWESIAYLTVSCRGCRATSFCERYTSAAEPDEELKVYPGRIEGRPRLANVHHLPASVKAIYLQTHSALCSKQPILAGMGIRAIIEAVCAEKAATGRDLKERIERLAALGHITADGAAILHELRFMGNKAAHEVKAHGEDELATAFEVVEYLLKGVYLIHGVAKRLHGRTSP